MEKSACQPAYILLIYNRCRMAGLKVCVFAAPKPASKLQEVPYVRDYCNRW